MRASLLLAALYLALALHGLGGADIIGDDEAREAGIVQEIVAGHVLWPRFNGELLPDKPLLFHWLAALPCAVAGFSEASVRLPSAVAGAALIGWTAHFGAELFGQPTGLVAAAVLATMPALFARARVARPDVLLVLLLGMALGFAFRWWRDGTRRSATVALALLGAATLAKGPVAPVLFGVTLGGFLVWQREWRGLRALFTGPGIAAFLLLGLGWYAIALGGWGTLFVREHLVGRYLRNLAGGLVRGAPYSPRPLSYHLLFYVEHLPAIALPWTPVTAVALWQAWRRDGLHDPRWRFLLCWVLAPVIVFTPAEWKLRHYLLPALPALALVTAPALLALWQETASRSSHRLVAAVALVAVFGIGVVATRSISLSSSDQSNAAVVADIIEKMPGGTRTAVAVAAVLAVTVLVAVTLGAWRVLVALTAAGTIAWMAVGAPALDGQESRRDSLKPFAALVAVRRPPPAELVFYGPTIRPLVVYLGRHIPSIREAGALVAGQNVIATEDAFRTLAVAARVGAPLLSAEGRVGNLGRERVVLAEVIPSPASCYPRARVIARR
ncbi:MAG TPA: glycosyltransferase family 39 protein [Candidatus Nitrosopolaris sp.]|nr:glycosyltransferase family 39 protein [Candidatus Nitrosopolaris sp.]